MASHKVVAVTSTELYPVYEINDDSQLPADLVARVRAALAEFEAAQSSLAEYRSAHAYYIDCACISCEQWGRQTSTPVCFCQRNKRRVVSPTPPPPPSES